VTLALSASSGTAQMQTVYFQHPLLSKELFAMKSPDSHTEYVKQTLYSQLRKCQFCGSVSLK